MDRLQKLIHEYPIFASRICRKHKAWVFTTEKSKGLHVTRKHVTDIDMYWNKKERKSIWPNSSVFEIKLITSSISKSLIVQCTFSHALMDAQGLALFMQKWLGSSTDQLFMDRQPSEHTLTHPTLSYYKMMYGLYRIAREKKVTREYTRSKQSLQDLKNTFTPYEWISTNELVMATLWMGLRGTVVMTRPLAIIVNLNHPFQIGNEFTWVYILPKPSYPNLEECVQDIHRLVREGLEQTDTIRKTYHQFDGLETRSKWFRLRHIQAGMDGVNGMLQFNSWTKFNWSGMDEVKVGDDFKSSHFAHFFSTNSTTHVLRVTVSPQEDVLLKTFMLATGWCLVV